MDLERVRRLRLKEREIPRMGMIPNASTTTLIAACQIRTAARVGTNLEADPYSSMTGPYNINCRLAQFRGNIKLQKSTVHTAM